MIVSQRTLNQLLKHSVDFSGSLAQLDSLYGINYFFYSRIYTNGLRVYLCSCPEDLNWYLTTNQFMQANTEGEATLYQDGFILSSSLPNQKIKQEAKQRFGFGNGMYYIKKHATYQEVFSFATNRDDECIINTYINERDVIVNTAKTIVDTSADLVKDIISLQLILPHSQLNHQTPNVSAMPFSPQQKAIVQLLKKGLTSKEIAIHLNISPYTVDEYIYVMKERFNFKKRSQLCTIDI